MEHLNGAAASDPTPLKGPRGRSHAKHHMHPPPKPSAPPTPLSPAPAPGGPHCGEPVATGEQPPGSPDPGSGSPGAFGAPPAAGTAPGAVPRNRECPRSHGACGVGTWDEPASPGSSPAPQHPQSGPPRNTPRTVAGFVAPSSSRLTHSKSPLILSGIPSREKGEGDVRPESVRPGARGGQGHRKTDGKQGWGSPPGPQGAHPSDVPAGPWSPFPDRRDEAAGGARGGRGRRGGRRQPRSGGLASLSHF